MQPVFFNSKVCLIIVGGKFTVRAPIPPSSALLQQLRTCHQCICVQYSTVGHCTVTGHCHPTTRQGRLLYSVLCVDRSSAHSQYRKRKLPNRLYIWRESYITGTPEIMWLGHCPLIGLGITFWSITVKKICEPHIHKYIHTQVNLLAHPWDFV